MKNEVKEINVPETENLAMELVGCYRLALFLIFFGFL